MQAVILCGGKGTRMREETEKIRAGLAESKENLANLTGYAVRYLRQLQKKHGPAFPRRTQIEAFAAIEVRELTASELTIRHDRAKGYLGHKVAGEPLLACSSLDKLLLVWKDGRYKVMAPPDKLFVDTTLIHAAVMDREGVMAVVYNEGGLTYLKRFTGGVVTNREYRCAPVGAEVLFFSDQDPPVLYVQYEAPATAPIRQQEFDTAKLPVRERDGRAVLMSSRRIGYVGAVKPRGWNDAATGPRGTFLDFG